MDTTVYILEWMEEYKTIGNHRRVYDRSNTPCSHPFMRFNNSGHQTWKINRTWTDKIYYLILIGDHLPDIILPFRIIDFLESRVNKPVLKIYQPFLLEAVFFFGEFQRSNEFLSSGSMRR